MVCRLASLAFPQLFPRVDPRGDGILDPLEQCDDGDCTLDNDGYD
jgi:hypothetical protein